MTLWWRPTVGQSHLNDLASQHSSSDGGDALRAVEIEGRDLSPDTRYVCEVVFWSTWTTLDNGQGSDRMHGWMGGWMIIWMKI